MSSRPCTPTVRLLGADPSTQASGAPPAAVASSRSGARAEVTDEPTPRTRRAVAHPRAASVAVQSSRDIVRAGLMAWIIRYPERLVLHGDQDARFADVLLVDAHDGAPASTRLRSPALDDRQRVVVVVDDQADLVTAEQRWPGARVLALDASAHEIVETLTASSKAALPTPARWPGDDVGLSRRESQVLGQLSMGRSNAEIAAALFVSVETVKTHLKQAYRRIGARNRVEAAAWAVDRNLVPAPHSVVRRGSRP